MTPSDQLWACDNEVTVVRKKTTTVCDTSLLTRSDQLITESLQKNSWVYRFDTLHVQFKPLVWLDLDSFCSFYTINCKLWILPLLARFSKTFYVIIDWWMCFSCLPGGPFFVAHARIVKKISLTLFNRLSDFTASLSFSCQKKMTVKKGFTGFIVENLAQKITLSSCEKGNIKISCCWIQEVSFF